MLTLAILSTINIAFIVILNCVASFLKDGILGLLVSCVLNVALFIFPLTTIWLLFSVSH